MTHPNTYAIMPTWHQLNGVDETCQHHHLLRVERPQSTGHMPPLGGPLDSCLLPITVAHVRTVASPSLLDSLRRHLHPRLTLKEQGKAWCHSNSEIHHTHIRKNQLATGHDSYMQVYRSYPKAVMIGRNGRREREFFLRSNKAFSGYLGLEGGELQSFRSCLKWVCVDQSNLWRTGLSWSIFFVLAIGVPILSHFLFSCSSCDDKHARPYDVIVQLSLSSLAALSFISLSALVKKYGLRRSLFLDKLCDVSEKVRLGYTQQLHFFRIGRTLMCGSSVVEFEWVSIN
ncbi:hypothetical protein CK203_098386 [Vitis vinifera]|uniref:Uncharacterized protein n=1 Tax=Vitis vinifera TaxID=29760 RepID=A0A438C6E3_VITVI|nr:hypothetical protein CK203_098386 [Vitis vinifera]